MYRDAELHDDCVECDAPATSACPRCGDRLCAAHAFSDEGMCRECELERMRRGSLNEGEVGVVATTVGASVAATVGVVFGFVAPVVLAVLATATAVAVPAAILYGRGRRRRFVLEHQRRAEARRKQLRP